MLGDRAPRKGAVLLICLESHATKKTQQERELSSQGKSGCCYHKTKTWTLGHSINTHVHSATQDMGGHAEVHPRFQTRGLLMLKPRSPPPHHVPLPCQMVNLVSPDTRVQLKCQLPAQHSPRVPPTPELGSLCSFLEACRPPPPGANPPIPRPG